MKKMLNLLCDLQDALHKHGQILRYLRGHHATIHHTRLIQPFGPRVDEIVLDGEKARDLAPLKDLSGNRKPAAMADEPDDGTIPVVPTRTKEIVDVREAAQSVAAEATWYNCDFHLRRVDFAHSGIRPGPIAFLRLVNRILGRSHNFY